MQEFYIRPENDPNYTPDVLTVSDEIEALIYQMSMILMTSTGEVLGAYKFGMSLTEQLFEFDFEPDVYTNALVDQTNVYCELARSYVLNYSIKKVKDGAYKYAVIIDAIINGKSVFGVLT
jgi:hypothetical protein